MVTISLRGEVVFRVYLPHAQDVDLMSSLDGWRDRAPLHRCDDDGSVPDNLESWEGWWEIRLDEVPKGEHSFSYLVDQTFWLPDYAAHGVQRNSMGNWTSLLVIVGGTQGGPIQLPSFAVRAIVNAPGTSHVP